MKELLLIFSIAIPLLIEWVAVYAYARNGDAYQWLGQTLLAALYAVALAAPFTDDDGV